MNHLYRSIWSDALGAWIAVSEIAKGKGKRSSKCSKLLATGLLVCSVPVWALPTGEQLVAGQASVSNPAANIMQIDQVSQRAAINWQGFSVANGEQVNIQQPNAQSALLNRVVGQDVSQIQGQLNANGQVYLVNPNGVVFSNTARVDVGGLIATTHSISNADFLSGTNHFTQNGVTTGAVENHGTINTPDGGVVVLIGQSVTNTGNINTPKGTTALAAGKTVDLDFQGNGLVEIKVSEAALNAQITNRGSIQADGGRVVLTAKAAGQLIDTVINQQGIIRAQSMVERNGEIILDGGDSGITQVSGTLNADSGTNDTTGGKISVTGDQVQINSGAVVTASGNTGGGTIVIGDKLATSQTTVQQGATVNAQALDHGTAGTINVFANMNNGTVNVAGNLDASAPISGDGGFIDTSAAHVKIADTATVTTKANTGTSGTWLIDPVDFTIASTGGDMTGAFLSASLASGSVTIASASGASGVNGDINVNDVVTWAANTRLTLNAARDINFNSALDVKIKAQINATGTNAGVALNPASGNYFLNGNSSITLSGANASFAVNGTAYTLIHTVNQLQAMGNNLAGNYALGNEINASAITNFLPVGTADGTPFFPTGSPFTGIFAGLGHTISNLTINRPNLDFVGLFGFTEGSTIRDVGMISANITGHYWVGGLVGRNYLGASISSTASIIGNVSGLGRVGGLVGENNGSISSASAIGNVSGSILHGGGGLVGYNSGSISNAHAAGSVTSGSGSGTPVGGLVGENAGFNGIFGSIDGAFSTSSVTGTNYVGGLVGWNDSSTFNNAYSTGNVSGTNYVGGLVGYNRNFSTISNAYATGIVSGTNNYVGGLVGWNDSSTISNAYYATGSVNGADYVGGLVGVNNSGSISNAYATGSVNGSGAVGGLVGTNQSSSTISNAYATGRVSGYNTVGGLVGRNSSSISNAYATGRVSGAYFVGGLVGFNDSATISNAFWDTTTTGQSNGVSNSTPGVVGKTTAEMMRASTFAAWNISATGGSSAVWRIYEGFTAPLLRFWLTPLTVDITQNPVAYSIANAASSRHLFNIGNPGFLYSDQQGYDISGTILTNFFSNPVPNEVPIITPTDIGPITSGTSTTPPTTSTAASKTDEAIHNACDNLASDSKCNNELSIDDDLPKLQVKNSAGKVLRSELSADRQFLTLLLEDGSVRVWDFKSGMQRNITTSTDKQSLTDISAVTDNNEVWVASKTGISIYDVMGSLIKDKTIDQPDINHFVTNTLGNPFLVNSGDGNLSLRTWKDNHYTEHWQQSYKYGAGYNMTINEPSSDDIRTAVLIQESFIYELKKPFADNRDALKPLTDAVDIIDAFNKDKLVHLRNLHENIIFTRFKDNDTLQLGLANGELSDWSIKSGSKKATVANFSEAVAVLDHDKETYAYITENGIVRVRNAQGSIQLSIQNQESPFKDVKLIDDAKKLLTVLENGDLAIWDIASGNRMLRLFSTRHLSKLSVNIISIS